MFSNAHGFSFDKKESVQLLGAGPYHTKANSYLLSIGLSQEEIDAIQMRLSN